jgi:hypothetical protein
MPAFLVSCRANADVEWIIYSDIDPPQGAPANVNFRRMSVEELNERCSHVLGTRVDIKRRKLCDLKVTYGVIFADDLLPFDFWGCSDLDIIWGDIRRFATDACLQAHDVFSSRKERLSGHCTFYRNTPEVNCLFERIPEVRTLLSTSHYEHLDERELTKYVRLPRMRTVRSPNLLAGGACNQRRLPKGIARREHDVEQRTDVGSRRSRAHVHPLPQTQGRHGHD